MCPTSADEHVLEGVLLRLETLPGNAARLDRRQDAERVALVAHRDLDATVLRAGLEPELVVQVRRQRRRRLDLEPLRRPCCSMIVGRGPSAMTRPWSMIPTWSARSSASSR